MIPWTLYATDQVGTRQAMIDVYQKAELWARANDVSTWQLTLPTDTEAGAILAADTRSRVEFAVHDEPWLSGPVRNLQRTVDMDGDTLTVAGADDTIWLRLRNAHPQPGTAAPPYSSTAYDVHTGPASVVLAELVRVNAGPSAVAHRRVAGLVVPVPASAGPVVTVSARWQNLLQLVQETARGAGLVFDTVGLTFAVRVPADAGVVFAAGLETLAAWTMVSPAPATNAVVVAGGGLGSARIIREVSDATSIAAWGLAETFVDRRDTVDLAQLDKAGADTLAVAPTTVVFTPIDTEGQAFGTDWDLGDLVTVRAGGLTVHDQIREIHVTLDTNGATVIPSVGEPAGDLALFRSLSGLDRRVRQLERV